MVRQTHYNGNLNGTFKYTKKNKQGNILQNKDDIDYEVNVNPDIAVPRGKTTNPNGLNKLSSKIIKGIRNVI